MAENMSHIKEAAEAVNGKEPAITRVCKGEYKSHRGMKFWYLEDK